MKSKLCKHCLGCCREDGYRDIIMSAYDARKLNSKCVKKVGPIYKFRKSKDAFCHFWGKGGCVLKYENRPLDCRIFPLTFNWKEGKPEFFFFAACPQIKRFSKNWIDRTKREAIKEIKNWSEKEIKFYTSTDPEWGLISLKKHKK